jgi:WD40 repeat protein
MATETTCLKCGAPLTGDARSGFCPKCLFAQASASDSDDLSHDSQLEPSGTAAPAASGSSDQASTTTGLPLPRAFGDYELLEEIARGGMGIVYRARHLSLDRIVAVKLLLFGPLSSPEFVKRFRAEASAAASLQHPNIVAIHEVGVHQGQHYFAMDFVEGQSLAKLISGFGFRIPDFKRAVGYLKTIAEAIHYAHERGILHRDLKPSNVLIDANDQPRVTDFGLARRLEGDSELTVTGQVLGSPNYMPPEQAVGKRGKVSRRSDVYSLGAMLYHLLTGRPPFVGEALTDTLEQVLNAEPVAPRLLNPSVPRDLETICLNCLEKEPDKRYATAQALADELGRFLNNEPVHAHPITRAERVWRWCRRKPALASLVVALHLVFALGLAGVFWQWRRAELNATHEAGERERAEQESLKARRFAYASDMNLAHQAVDDGDLFRAFQLLDRHRPTFGVPALAGSPPKRADGETDRLKAGLQTDLRGWEWRYLWQQCQGDQRFILGYHSNGVTAVGFLPDGKAAFSAGNDKVVRLWDLESRQQIGLLKHEYGVSGAACSPDGRWLATGTESEHVKGPLRLWNLATREATVLTTHFWLRPTLVLSPDSELLAFVDLPRGVHLWSISAGQVITNLPAESPYLSPLGVAFSPDGQTLAYAENRAGDIVLWDLRSRSVVQRLSGHQWCVTALAFTPDGQFLASGGMDRMVKLWDVAAGRARDTFTNYTDSLTALAFSRNGETLAIACGQRLTLLDITRRTEVSQLRGHQSLVTGLALTPDGRSLITGGGFGMMGIPGGDGTVRVWDVAARPKESETRRFQTGLTSFGGGSGAALCLSPDGRHLLSAFTDNTFSIWETPKLTEISRRPLPLTNFACAALATGGKLVAFVAEDGNILFWHSDSNQTNWFARPTTNTSNRAVFSSDGNQLALGGGFGEVCVCDVTGRTKLHRFRNDGHVVMSLAFAKDSQKLMAGFHSGLVKVWDLSGHNGERTFERHNKQVRGLALLPDGQTLVSAGTDVRFWDLNSQREFVRIQPRQTQFLSCSISPDGRRLAVGAADGLITIWDLASRQEVATLNGLDRRVNDVAFLSDGHSLVSVGQEQVRVWRAASFEETDREALKQ